MPTASTGPFFEMCQHAASMCRELSASAEPVPVLLTLQGVRPLEGEQLGPGETREQWLRLAAGPRVPADH